MGQWPRDLRPRLGADLAEAIVAGAYWLREPRPDAELTIAYCGAVAGTAVVPLGVDRFGQSGDIPDLFRAYGIDTEAILDAAARACLTALRGSA